MASVFDLIAGTYVTIYNRAADPQGANFWATTLGFANINEAAGATASLALADQLAPNFYAASSAAFDALYPTSMLDSQYINNIYVNLGGLPPDSEGATFWGNRLSTLEATNSQQVARAIVASEISFVLQTFDPNATGDAKIRADTYKNKLVVSEAVASTGNATFNPASQSSSDPAYAGETNVLIGINETDASRNVALGQVQAANAANNPSLMVGQFVTTFTLTPNVDTFEATQAGSIFTALPELASSGLANNTLNTGDTLTTTGAAVGASTLNYTAVNNGTLGAVANPPYAPGVTLQGINALNITNQSGGVTDLSGNPINTTTAGFQGNVTGLRTVVNASSQNSVQLGAVGTSLGSALASYTSNGGTNQNFTAVIAAAALAGATDAISVDLNGNTGAAANPNNFAGAVPVGGTSIKLVFAPDGSANGYETWNIASNGPSFLRLGQGTGGQGGDFGAGFGSATNLVLTGAGSVELSALNAGDFAGLKTIDATAATGAVTLTGGAANSEGGYYSAVGSTVSNEAGLLTSGGGNILAPTLIRGSTTAANFIDLSGVTDANIYALAGTGTTDTLTGNTAAGVTNTLILNNAVVTGTTALAGESGFQTIGVTGLRAGTINLANFTDANEIKLFGPASVNLGQVTVTNGSPTFTLDLNGNTGTFPNFFHSFAVNGPANTTDVFNLKMGTAAYTHGTGAGGVDAAPTAQADIIAPGILPFHAGLTVNGYETVNINVTDGPALPAVISIFTNLTNVPDIILGGIALTPTVGGGEILNVTGTGDLVSLINLVTPAGPLANIDYEVGGVVVNANNFIINSTQTGLLAFGGTNALQVNGATSGGVVMVGGVDTNTLGATLTGSTSHWNALAGSVSKDTFNGGTGQFSPFVALQGDVYGTNGGADTVNLAAGHTLAHIDVYGTDGDPDLSLAGLNYEPIADSITSSLVGLTTADLYQPGFGGVATGGAPIQFGAGTGIAGTPLFADVGGFSGGESASQVNVNGFVAGNLSAGGDVINFSIGAWGTGATAANAAFGLPAMTDLGLVDTNFAAFAGPVNATFTHAITGIGITDPGRTIVEIASSHTNANDLAQFLHSAAGDITFGAALGAGDVAHMLFAYTDGSNVHIADVEFVNNTLGAVGDSAGMTIVAAHDMVQLTGIASVSALDHSGLTNSTHNIHFLA